MAECMEYKLSMFNNLIDREAETLLFNSRTRALVKLDGAEKNMYFLAMNDGVRISEYAVKNNEFFTDLYTNEFIVEYDKDEFDLLNTMNDWITKIDSNIFFNITNGIVFKTDNILADMNRK